MIKFRKYILQNKPVMFLHYIYIHYTYYITLTFIYICQPKYVALQV